MSKSICILLPVLNEVEQIEALLSEICQELKSYSFTVCIIDDGSTDGTLDIIQRVMEQYPGCFHLMRRVKQKAGCQRGGALYAGLQWALRNGSFDVFVEMDGDFSHLPSEIKNGIVQLDSVPCDVALASKYINGSKVTGRGATRSLISFCNSMLMRIILPSKISDYSNGFRFYTQEAAYILDQHNIFYNSPIYLLEVLAIWLKADLKIVEFPSTYVGRSEGVSKVLLLDVVKGVVGALHIAWQYHFSSFSRSEVYN